MLSREEYTEFGMSDTPEARLSEHLRKTEPEDFGLSLDADVPCDEHCGCDAWRCCYCGEIQPDRGLDD